MKIDSTKECYIVVVTDYLNRERFFRAQSSYEEDRLVTSFNNASIFSSIEDIVLRHKTALLEYTKQNTVKIGKVASITLSDVIDIDVVLGDDINYQMELDALNKKYNR